MLLFMFLSELVVSIRVSACDFIHHRLGTPKFMQFDLSFAIDMKIDLPTA